MAFEPNLFYSDQEKISLSDLLDQLEIDISHVGQGDRTRAEKMLIRMDVTHQKISNLVASKIIVTAENAQFDYIRECLEKNGRSVLSDLGGINQLNELRKKVKPEENQPWWFVEQSIERQKRKMIRSIGIPLGITAMIVLILAIIFNTILKPDPIVVARYTHEINAEQFLVKNDLENALVEVNSALTLGQDAKFLILRGVIEDRLGQKTEAEADFGIAESIIGDRNNFLLSRAESWLRVGQLDDAKLDIQETIRNDPESAQAYFFDGKILELEKDYFGAVNRYQKASELAEKQGKAELNATIRMSMAMLMQSIPPEISVTSTATP